MDKRYQVTYACDYMDTNPTIITFDLFDEMSDWIEETVSQRMDWIVQHSPWTIYSDEWYELQENENSLIKVKEI